MDLIVIFTGAIATLALIPLTVLGGMGIARANLKSRLADRQKAIETYRLLVQDKLDTIKTALVVGYKSDELKDLDERLEKLIGADEMRALLDSHNEKVPLAPAQLPDADLAGEIERLRRTAESRPQSTGKR
jgi:hypothetical protein